MTNKMQLTNSQLNTFNSDGFVVIPSVLTQPVIKRARDRFEQLFSGKFETGIQPDEWNWKSGQDDPTLTRQICNAWKSDLTIASIALRSDIGAACAKARGWPGARINQDNVIWKPPGSKALGFHQDDSYQTWITPAAMMTCWITLDDTLAEQGTIEYVKGSHLWPLSQPIQQFHAPDDPLADMKIAAKAAGKSIEIVPIEVPAGSAVLHHGRTWHGSRANSGESPRRSIVSHCMSSEAQFHSVNNSPIYSRYKQRNSQEMHESYFPIIWRDDGYRSEWIEPWLAAK